MEYNLSAARKIIAPVIDKQLSAMIDELWKHPDEQTRSAFHAIFLDIWPSTTDFLQVASAVLQKEIPEV